MRSQIYLWARGAFEAGAVSSRMMELGGSPRIQCYRTRAGHEYTVVHSLYRT